MTSHQKCSLCLWEGDFPASKLVHLDAHGLKWTVKNYCELYGLIEHEVLEKLTETKKKEISILIAIPSCLIAGIIGGILDIVILHGGKI